VSTPGGVTVAGAVAECDATAVEDDSDLERPLALRQSLGGHHSRTQVEACSV